MKKEEGLFIVGAVAAGKTSIIEPFLNTPNHFHVSSERDYIELNEQKANASPSNNMKRALAHAGGHLYQHIQKGESFVYETSELDTRYLNLAKQQKIQTTLLIIGTDSPEINFVRDEYRACKNNIPTIDDKVILSSYKITLKKLDAYIDKADTVHVFDNSKSFTHLYSIKDNSLTIYNAVNAWAQKPVKGYDAKSVTVSSEYGNSARLTAKRSYTAMTENTKSR